MKRILQNCRDHMVDKLRDWLALSESRRHEEMLHSLKSRLKTCGDGVHIRMPIRYSGPENWEIGSNFYLGENAFIRAEGGLSIGSNTVISRNLVVYTVNHNWQGERLPYDSGTVRKPVRIGNNVWIGMNVMICPGTIIHDGVVVGMGSVVSGEVPPLAVIAGQKWRKVGERDSEGYHQKVRSRSYSDPFGKALAIQQQDK